MSACEGLPSEALRVRLPPLQPIVNELLCFVQNKVDVLPLDALVRICAEFYSFEAISVAKDLLFQTVVTRQRKIQRKINKSKTSLEDIVKVFLEMEITNAPIFVARNLAELPPFSADIGDSLKVLRELDALKTQIKLIENNQLKMMRTIKTEKEKNSLSKNCDNLDSDDTVTGVFSPDLSPDDSDHTHDDEEEPTDEESNGPESSDEDFPALGRQTHPQTAGIWEKVKTRIFTRQHIDKQSVKPLHSTTRTTTPRNQVVIGSGKTSMRLKSAPNHHNQVSTQSRQCTGIFVTRLDPNSTVAKVGIHIRNATGVFVKPEKLQTKYNTYASFYIRCDSKLRNSLMDATMWPSGTLVKQFFE